MRCPRPCLVVVATCFGDPFANCHAHRCLISKAAMATHRTSTTTMYRKTPSHHAPDSRTHYVIPYRLRIPRPPSRWYRFTAVHFRASSTHGTCQRYPYCNDSIDGDEDFEEADIPRRLQVRTLFDGPSTDADVLSMCLSFKDDLEAMHRARDCCRTWIPMR